MTVNYYLRMNNKHNLLHSSTCFESSDSVTCELDVCPPIGIPLSMRLVMSSSLETDIVSVREVVELSKGETS